MTKRAFSDAGVTCTRNISHGHAKTEDMVPENQSFQEGPRKPKRGQRKKIKAPDLIQSLATSRCGRQKATRKHHESETSAQKVWIVGLATTVPSPHKMERSIGMTCCNVWKIALLSSMFNVLDFLKNNTGTRTNCYFCSKRKQKLSIPPLCFLLSKIGNLNFAAQIPLLLLQQRTEQCQHID